MHCAGNKHNEGDLKPPQSDFRLPAAPLMSVVQAHRVHNVSDAESVEPDPVACSGPCQSESACHHQPVLLASDHQHMSDLGTQQ